MKNIKHLFIITLTLFITSCVQESMPKDITVKLDMRAVENPSNVGIRGNFPLSWDETTPLEDTNNDGIYKGTFNIYTASNGVKFKFVNQNDQFELEGQENRVLAFDYKPETITIEAVFNNPETKIIKQ